MKSVARSLALLSLLTAGCGVHSLLNKLDNESEDTVDLVCSCTNVFPDKAMCEAQFSSFFDIYDRDCVEDALAEDKGASKESLQCILDQQKSYNKCLKDKLDCNDQTSFMGCESAFETDCPQLPAAVQTKLQTCGSNQ